MTIRTFSSVICDRCGTSGPPISNDGISQIAVHELARRWTLKDGWRQVIADRRFLDLCSGCYRNSEVAE